MLSIIVLSYYSSSRIKEVCYRIEEEMIKNNIPYEIIIIDDGSKDDSYKLALEIEKQNPDVHSYQLSKNFGSFNSIFVGLSIVKGKCATIVPEWIKVI